MKTRIDYAKVSPHALRGMMELERYIHDCGLEQNLIHMVKLRASQMNGCAYCIDMHWKDARALGESEQRLYGLDAWEESPYYSERERMALLWVESVTHITDGHAPDAVYDKVRAVFNEKEMVDLTILCTTINAWNRLAISMRAEPGLYQSRVKP